MAVQAEIERPKTLVPLPSLLFKNWKEGKDGERDRAFCRRLRSEQIPNAGVVDSEAENPTGSCGSDGGSSQTSSSARSP